MRQVSWQTSPGAVVALLNAGTQVFMSDLYTITLSGGLGLTVRYTSGDVSTVANGNLFTAGPVITRGQTKVSIGVAVDALHTNFAADASVTINGTPLLQFINRGGFDGARVLLERAFAASPQTSWVGALVLFQGRVGEPRIDRYSADVPINSDSELLNVMVPATIYQPGCSNNLFDATCGLGKSGYATSATATSATDLTRTVFSTALGNAPGHFALGWAVGATGANAGVARTIKAFAGGAFTSVLPWPLAVAVGDTFTAYPGCDKTQATCTTKFSNVIRFRGMPYVPAPETVV